MSLNEVLADYLDFTFQNARMTLPWKKWFAPVADTSTMEKMSDLSTIELFDNDDDEPRYRRRRSKIDLTFSTDVVSLEIKIPQRCFEKEFDSFLDKDTYSDNPGIYFKYGSLGSGTDECVAVHTQIYDYFRDKSSSGVTFQPSSDGESLILETHSAVPFRWLLILKDLHVGLKDAVVEICGPCPPSVKDSVLRTPEPVLRNILTNCGRYVTNSWACFEVLGFRNTDPATYSETPFDDTLKWSRADDLADYLSSMCKDEYGRGHFYVDGKMVIRQDDRECILSDDAQKVLDKTGELQSLDFTPFHLKAGTGGEIVISNRFTEMWARVVSVFTGKDQVVPTIRGVYSSDSSEYRNGKMKRKLRDEVVRYHGGVGVMGEDILLARQVLDHYGVYCYVERMYLS